MTFPWMRKNEIRPEGSSRLMITFSISRFVEMCLLLRTKQRSSRRFTVYVKQSKLDIHVIANSDSAFYPLSKVNALTVSPDSGPIADSTSSELSRDEPAFGRNSLNKKKKKTTIRSWIRSCQVRSLLLRCRSRHSPLSKTSASCPGSHPHNDAW